MYTVEYYIGLLNPPVLKKGLHIFGNFSGYKHLYEAKVGSLDRL